MMGPLTHTKNEWIQVLRKALWRIMALRAMIRHTGSIWVILAPRVPMSSRVATLTMRLYICSNPGPKQVSWSRVGSTIIQIFDINTSHTDSKYRQFIIRCVPEFTQYVAAVDTPCVCQHALQRFLFAKRCHNAWYSVAGLCCTVKLQWSADMATMDALLQV